MLSAVDDIGLLLFRLSAMMLSTLLEALIPLAKNSLDRTEIRGYSKGYRQIALGKIKLPDAIKPKLRTFTLFVTISLLIDPIQTILREVF